MSWALVTSTHFHFSSKQMIQKKCPIKKTRNHRYRFLFFLSFFFLFFIFFILQNYRPWYADWNEKWRSQLELAFNLQAPKGKIKNYIWTLLCRHGKTINTFWQVVRNISYRRKTRKSSIVFFKKRWTKRNLMAQLKNQFIKKNVLWATRSQCLRQHKRSEKLAASKTLLAMKRITSMLCIEEMIQNVTPTSSSFFFS